MNDTITLQRQLKESLKIQEDEELNIDKIQNIASKLIHHHLSNNRVSAARAVILVIESICQPMGQLSYQYGRVCIREGKYQKAYTLFNNIGYINWKILVYLLPLEYLINNKLPNDLIWEKYPILEPLKPLFNAIKSNNVKLFKSLINYNAQWLNKIHLLSLYKQLINPIRINNLQKISMNYPKHIIPISIIANINNEPITSTECYISQMINGGKVRGYISHSHCVIVLSKQSPFQI